MKITKIGNPTNHANSIGMALRNPLFRTATLCGRLTLTDSDTIGPSEQIARHVAAFFLAMLSFIPLGSLWLAGKGISMLGTPSMRSKGVSLAPPPIQAPPVLPEEAQNLNQLYTDFEQSIPQAKRETFQRACRIIQNKESVPLLNERHNQELFLNEMTLFLQNIYLLLQDPAISQAKKDEALTLLADGFLVCSPTWLEQARKAYLALSGQEETGETLLLRHIQSYKDTYILEYVQNKINREWHALNYVRSLLADSLGLSKDYEQDPFIGQRYKVFGPGFCRWLFMQIYEDVNRLVSAIKTSINLVDFEAKYGTMLTDAVQKTYPTMEDPVEYVLNHFYEDDRRTINSKGVIALLSIIGILN